ncbi:HAD hydrolase-like protein [Streptomyces sp. NPDC017435]|uniref:HAD hydrolase-like protein n=1 Tax=Streptomyces sp. NPDC017435 TaxID=3364995 RepID=UPI0037B7B8A9
MAALHGVPASEVLHIGDNFACDVQGALAAGAQALWIASATPGPAARRLLASHPGMGAHRARPGHRGHPRRAGHLRSRRPPEHHERVR